MLKFRIFFGKKSEKISKKILKKISKKILKKILKKISKNNLKISCINKEKCLSLHK
jgi:hypothetical protein